MEFCHGMKTSCFALCHIGGKHLLPMSLDGKMKWCETLCFWHSPHGGDGELMPCHIPCFQKLSRIVVGSTALTGCLAKDSLPSLKLSTLRLQSCCVVGLFSLQTFHLRLEWIQTSPVPCITHSSRGWSYHAHAYPPRMRVMLTGASANCSWRRGAIHSG